MFNGMVLVLLMGPQEVLPVTVIPLSRREASRAQLRVLEFAFV